MVRGFKVALLQKRIPVGAKEESWVSAQEILKSLLRDSQSTTSTMCAYVLLFLFVLTLVCLFVVYLLVFKTLKKDPSCGKRGRLSTQ